MFNEVQVDEFMHIRRNQRRIYCNALVQASLWCIKVLLACDWCHVSQLL